MDDMDGGIAGASGLDGTALDDSGEGAFDMCGGLDLGELDDEPLGADAEFGPGSPDGLDGFGQEPAVDFHDTSDWGFASEQVGYEWDEAATDMRPDPAPSFGTEEDLGGNLEVAGEVEELEGLMDGINPGFDPFSDGPSSTNCGACALALEARLSGADPGAVAGPENVGTVEEMNRSTGMEQVPMAPGEIAAHAESMGPGYHAIVGFDRASGADGHWFNVAVPESGRVYALDSQCGVALPFGEYVMAYADDGVNFDLSMRKG